MRDIEGFVSTYTLIPGPVPTHEITIPMFLVLEVTVWSIVDTRGKLGVCKEMVDDLSGVVVPELIFGLHPLWHRASRRAEPLVLGSVRPPWDISQFDRIDPHEKVLMINDRGDVATWDERSSPDIEELVDETLREVSLEV